ncbi:MAG: rRNA maturation RNase YbeY [Vicinamibacteria bacterium]|nr:rRNA maturation RNase YbeY [Vicinamibacteria bacterium]
MKHEPPSTGGLSVLIVNRQRRHRIKADRLRALLSAAARSLKVTGEVALVFAGDRLLHRLNRDYRFKDKPTDVLSFESQGEDMGLGDIFISVETARANAKRLNRALDRELEILALHGFLHVLGYDHETDHGEMDALEKRLRARCLTRAAPRRAAA